MLYKAWNAIKSNLDTYKLSQQVLPKCQDILPCWDLPMSYCVISVWSDCMMISGPVRSPLRSDLYYFRRFLFYRFCLLVFNFKKLKRSDWISNSRASNFRIGFPSWRRTKRGGGWCTLVHWEKPPLLPPYHHYNFLDFNQRKFLLST